MQYKGISPPIKLQPFKFSLLLLSASIAAVVVLDPFLVNMVPNDEVKGLLKYYPYELSSLLFLSLISLFVLVRTLSRARIDIDKAFIILFLLAYHTVNLFRLGPLEGTDFVVGFFFLVFISEMLIEGRIATGKSLIILNLFFAVCVIPSLIYVDPVHIVLALFKICKLGMLSYLLANYIYRKRLIKFFAKWFVIFTIGSAFIAILQQVIYQSTGELLVGVLTKHDMRYNFEETPWGKFYRFSGFVSGYKVFSNLLILSLTFLVNLYLYNKPESKFKKILLFVSFLAMSLALLLTFSKDAVFVLSLVLAISLIFRWSHRALHFLAGFVSVSVLLYLTGVFEYGYKALISELEFGEFRIRRQFMREGIYGYFSRHPWIGVGVDKSPLYTAHYTKWPPHNGFIVAADETGLIGLFCFLIILTWCFYKLIALNISVKNSRQIWIVRGFLIGFVGFMATMNFHPTFLDNILWIYLGMIYAIALGYMPQENESVSFAKARGYRV